MKELRKTSEREVFNVTNKSIYDQHTEVAVFVEPIKLPMFVEKPIYKKHENKCHKGERN